MCWRVAAVRGNDGCARGGGDVCRRVTASRHWCHGVVRVQRGLRGAAVMWFGRRRSVARAHCTRWSAHAARRVGGARGLAVQATRRHSQLHRWGMQRLPARRGAAILHPISQRAARIEGMALCTRARRVRIARRGDRTVNYVRAMPGQQSVRRSGSKSQDLRLHSSEAKLIRVPKEAYLKSHPRNTLVTAASTGALQRNRQAATR